jgi:hypothetical protein
MDCNGQNDKTERNGVEYNKTIIDSCLGRDWVNMQLKNDVGLMLVELIRLTGKLVSVIRLTMRNSDRKPVGKQERNYIEQDLD